MSPLNRLDIKETSHHKKGLEIPANSVQVTRLCEKIYTSNNFQKLDREQAILHGVCQVLLVMSCIQCQC